jgi:hypothetical protein
MISPLEDISQINSKTEIKAGCVRLCNTEIIQK